MYLEHFGLDRPPFKITPDTSLFYEGSKRGAALDALVYAIRSGEGIIKVVGEVGSGKTMLCRMLEVRLSEDIDIVYIANPNLSPDNILHVIAHELHIEIDANEDKLLVMRKLQDYLLKKHADNRQVVVFVEEAQSMPLETLEEIRLLSNLETDRHKLLQMVLFGQPELDEKLSQPHIRQLRERITHSFYLDPFPVEDTLDYLNFRMRSVGYRGPDLFSRRVAKKVERYSDGLTRRINIIADKTLMAVYSEGGHAVTGKHVRAAAKDSHFARPGNSRYGLYGGLIVAGLAVAVWLGTLLPGWSSRVDDAAPPAGSGSAHTTAAADPLPVQREQGVQAGEIRPVNATNPGNENIASTEDLNDRLLDRRLGHTSAWLQQAPDDHYSIQLSMTYAEDADALEQFLRNPPDLLDLEKIYVYETMIGGNRMYSVLYGDYTTRRIARSMLSSLPDHLQANKPYVRRLSALRKDPQADS